ncbi:MAG: amidohydrolase family protein [Phycisphaerales bacterium]|nr:MAG: amidohydrolase family protein [Phycisphaerales bacterium]
MKTARILVISLLVFALSQNIRVWGQEPQTLSEETQRPAVIAFVNVSVVPMDRERILPGQTVIVRADRISEIGPADTTDIPEGALRIDGRDKYLMPGLVDMHVHQAHDAQLILFIANGVTAVRNMWGTQYNLTLRERIERGGLVGPTIYTTGPLLDGNPPIWPQSTVVETPEQADEVVAEDKEAGYGFIKVYSRLTTEVYDAIVDAGTKHGIPVVGHVPGAVGLEHALVAKQYSVEHLSGYGDFLQVEDSSHWEQIDETKIPHIVQTTREAGTWNCVTLVVHERMMMSSEEVEQALKRTYMKYVSPMAKQRWSLMRGEQSGDPNRSHKMSNRKRMTKALHDGGARILLGSDTPNPYVVPGFSLHEELRNLVDAGLTPYEAMKAGTRDAAECLGEQDEFGTIRAGLRADLILIEDNPFEDVANVARLSGVMARGRWLPQSKLQGMLDALAVKHATEENPDGVMLRGRWYSRTELEAMADAQDKSQNEELVEAVLSSDRIFLTGAGDSEPVARSAATKLMRAGLQVYVAADATTPEIKKGDLLIAISRSGRTTATYGIAFSAKDSGAAVVLLTSQAISRIGKISDMLSVLGPDFYPATELFFDKLCAAALARKTSATKPGVGYTETYRRTERMP